MSKLNNLIGFWNNKSAEQEDKKAFSPKATRPKSEIIDRNFVKRMENCGGGERGPRERGGLRFLLSEEIKAGERPPGVSDDRTQVLQGGAGPSPRLGERGDRAELSASPGKRGPAGLAQSPPASPLALSTPASPAWSSKPQSPFAKFKQLDQNFSSSQDSVRSQAGPRPTNLYRNASMPASTARPTVTHNMMNQKNNPATKSSLAARSGSGAKEMILMWVQNRIRDYPIPMTNFSTHWNDGLAFCALIHVFYPDNFDWFSLKAENRRHNFTFAFQKAEELADIYPLLEVDDMVKFQKPDWKCVFTYVQSFYRRFRDGRSPPPRSGAGGQTGAPGGGGELKLSEVARAVADCQEAEQVGRKIVKQISLQEKQAVPAVAAEHTQEKKEVEEKPLAEEEKPAESEEVSSDLPVRAVEPRAPVTPEETPREVLTESVSTLSITLKPSPAKLSPKASSAKMSRSKSVASEHPDTGEDSSSVQERKFSFNHPRPSMSPPALQL